MAFLFKRTRRADKEAQTMIRVYPHVFKESMITTHITSDIRTQTEITLPPKQDDKHIYSLLEYIPFQDLREQNMRVLSLPRKQRLQFTSATKVQIEDCSGIIDDDGIHELCLDLKERARKSTNVKTKTFATISTQTNQE